MFKKKEVIDSSNVDTVIGLHTKLEGTITAEGTIRIEGNVKGDVFIEGNVVIGNSAVITGNLKADNIELHGAVEGNIQVKELLKLSPTARLYGDISVKSFVTDEGALFQGNCNMASDTSTFEKSMEKPASRRNSKDFKKSSLVAQVEEKSEETAESK